MPVDHAGWLKAQGEDAPLLTWALTPQGWAASPPATLGVAVSGGSDSMAMLHLLARAAPQAGWQLHAVTVDHRLRPEAADEAAFVARECTKLGVPHDILVWDHGAIRGNLMQAARDARYAAMAGWAGDRGVDLVTLAHTADDQAETFLMGLSRAAGLDGLTGMRPAFTVEGVTFRRPFLPVTRTDLRAYLVRHGLRWIDDPTNDNDRFTRVKARRALKALKPLGITVDRLSGVVHNLAMAQGVVRQAVADAAARVVTESAGALRFEAAALRRTGPEIERRLLIGMIVWMTGAAHPPRSDQVARLIDALHAGRDATLAGVRFRARDGQVQVLREPRAVMGPVPVTARWDHRWTVEGPAAPGQQLRALGPEGLARIKDWRATGHPREALIVSPAIWADQTLIAAPLAGKAQGWTVTIRPSFAGFIISH